MAKVGLLRRAGPFGVQWVIWKCDSYFNMGVEPKIGGSFPQNGW